MHVLWYIFVMFGCLFKHCYRTCVVGLTFLQKLCHRMYWVVLAYLVMYCVFISKILIQQHSIVNVNATKIDIYRSEHNFKEWNELSPAMMYLFFYPKIKLSMFLRICIFICNWALYKIFWQFKYCTVLSTVLFISVNTTIYLQIRN